jgi:hypothetical protein
MKTVIFLSTIFFLVFCNTKQNNSCSKNINYMDNWEANLCKTGYTKHSLKIYVNNSYKKGVSNDSLWEYKIKEYVYYFSRGLEPPIKITQNIYDNPCSAVMDYKISVNYFQTEEPKYDKNNSFYAGLLVNNMCFQINGRQQNDSSMKIFFTLFKQSILKETPESNSEYVRFSDQKVIKK